MVEENELTLKTYFKELYEEFIEDNLKYIRFIGEENKILQGVRENHYGEWKIVEACKEIMFDNVKEINALTEEIGDERRKIKELG